MGTLRIAVVGAGYIGLAHIDAICNNPALQLVAVVDPSSAAQAKAQALGVAHYGQLEAMLAAEHPDGVVLATPNQLHVPQAIACIEAGTAVLLEKPIAPTVAEAQTLVAAVDGANAKLLIGHHRAHSPIMAKAKQVVDSGKLGRLVGVMGSATFYKPDSYFAAGRWRTEPGGGPILINMIHEVHNLRILCGEIIAVQALASHAVRGFAVEDTVSISLRFANGALGSFLLSDTAACARSWEQTSQENAAYPSYADEDCYVVSGTNGSLSVPTMRTKTYATAQDRSWWKPFESGVVEMLREDPIKLQMAHFAEVIRGTAKPLVSAHDGLANLRVTEAIATAAATGRTVEISPL